MNTRREANAKRRVACEIVIAVAGLGHTTGTAQDDVRDARVASTEGGVGLTTTNELMSGVVAMVTS